MKSNHAAVACKQHEMRRYALYWVPSECLRFQSHLLLLEIHTLPVNSRCANPLIAPSTFTATFHQSLPTLLFSSIAYLFPKFHYKFTSNFFSFYQFKTGKNVAEMTRSVSSETYNLNSINTKSQSYKKTQLVTRRITVQFDDCNIYQGKALTVTLKQTMLCVYTDGIAYPTAINA